MSYVNTKPMEGWAPGLTPNVQAYTVAVGATAEQQIRTPVTVAGVIKYPTQPERIAIKLVGAAGALVLLAFGPQGLAVPTGNDWPLETQDSWMIITLPVTATHIRGFGGTVAGSVRIWWFERPQL